MDAADTIHPADETLHAYGLGKLDDTTGAAVHDHLEDCPACRGRLAGLSSDSFLDRLRESRKVAAGATTGVSPIDGMLGVGPAKGPTLPPSAESLPPGLTDHADYQIRRELGRGGMGVVYLAHNSIMGRDEVLKVIGRQIMERPAVMERFLREIRAVAKLRHPNIVTAYSAFRIEGGLVFAMEHVEGLDLSRLVQSKGPLPVAHASYFIHQAAVGLQHAHERGMVHRDIKPHNLMLTHDGKARVVKILDFGLAKATREEKIDGGLTSQGQALGTPDYIAPEQILDAAGADIRADLYSLGGTLYYLLTGRPPFQATSLYDLYQAHISRDADPLNLVRPEIPAELAALVAKLMAKDPARRFQTPGEVAEALKPFFKRGTAKVNPELSTVERPAPPPVKTGAARTPAGMAKGPKGTAPVTKKTAEAPPAGVNWADLIDPEDTGQLLPPMPRAVPTTKRGKPRWIWPSLVAGLLLFGLVTAWGAWRVLVQTREGTIVLDGLPDQADVLIDGEKATIQLRDGGGPVEVSAPPGRRGVRVKKDGFETFGTEVTLATGEKTLVRVSLKPLDAPGESGPTGAGTPPPFEIDDERRNRAILAKLKRPIPMKFGKDSPLDDVLKYVREATEEPNGKIIPIYVDPHGLQEVDKTMASTVSLDLDGVPLETTLRLMLNQIGMDYCVKAGLIYITDKEGIPEARKKSWSAPDDGSPRSAATLPRLDAPIAMRFPTDTPLDDVIRFLKDATKGPDGQAIPIYVDPAGLQDADKTMASTVAIYLEGVPLRTTLRLLLHQIGMGYSVKDGVVNITSWALGDMK